MYTLKLYRDNDFQNERTCDLAKAVEILFVYELGYGGNVTAATETEVETTTRVLSKVDKTIITGTKEEMRPILQGLSIYLESAKMVDNRAIEKTFEVLEAINGGPGRGVVPFHVHAMSGFLMGKFRANIPFAMMVALGYTDEFIINVGEAIDPKILMDYKNLTKDIYAIHALHQETKQPVKDIICELGLQKKA